jgi:hypothetical protein
MPEHRLDEDTKEMVLQTEELTFGCGEEGGTLIGFTFCFSVGNATYCGLGDQRTNTPRGDWACPACIDHARTQLKLLPVCGEDLTESDEDPEGSSERVESEESESESGESDEHMSIEQIQNSSTTVVMLKTELDRLGLPKTGRKHQLVKRLLDHHHV